MVLAVAGLMTFTAKYASAQEDTAGAATEEVVSAEATEDIVALEEAPVEDKSME